MYYFSTSSLSISTVFYCEFLNYYFLLKAFAIADARFKDKFQKWTFEGKGLR
jgi:hypothetical protein